MNGNNENLLIIGLKAAEKAGRAIMEIYKSGFAIELKDDRTPLTMADRNSHKIITEFLLEDRLHSYPVLSEEGKDILYNERRDWEYFWLIDPLDGTKEFIKRNGEFTVNIALIHYDRPALGVVFAPAKGICYFAAEGIGAYRLEGIEETIDSWIMNELFKRSIKLPVKGKGRPFTVVGSRSHMSKETGDFIGGLKKKHNEVEIISVGSSLKLCMVAEGKADVYPRFAPTMEWDTAAGQAIVEQAGGVVSNYETGRTLEYNKENLLNPWFIAGKREILL